MRRGVSRLILWGGEVNMLLYCLWYRCLWCWSLLNWTWFSRVRLFCWEVGPFHIYSCLWFLLSVLSCYWEVGQLLVIFIFEVSVVYYNILLVCSGTIHYLFLLYLSLVQMVYDFAWLHSIRYFTLCSPFLNEGRSVTNIGMQLCAQLGFMNVCLYLWDSRRDDVTWQRGRLVTWCFGVDLAPNLISWDVTTEGKGATRDTGEHSICLSICRHQ